MSSDFKAVLPGLGVLVFGVGVAIYVMGNLEKVPETRYRGYQGEAAYNDYLALSLMLEEMGLTVKRIPRLGARDELPPVDGTLILPGARSTYSASRYDQLLDWVREGGHLVAAPRYAGYNFDFFGEAEESPENERRDPLLVRLELGLRDVGPEASETEDGSADGFVDYTESPFLLPGTDLRVRASIPNRLRVEGEAAAWSIGPPAKARIVHRAVGEGGVTVVADEHWLRSFTIGDYEHATLAHYLATLDGRRGEVWVVYGADVPGIVALTFEHGWPTLLAGTLALVLWLVARARAFGPRHPVREDVRRSVLEHIEATANFLWQRDAGLALLDSVKAAVLGKAARSTLDWQGLSPEERRAHVREVAAISPAELERLFGPSNPGDPATFTATVQTLREIHQRL